MDRWAQDPDRLVDLRCEAGAKKRLRRLAHVRELYRPFSRADSLQLLRDWFRSRNALKEVVSLSHARYSAKAVRRSTVAADDVRGSEVSDLGYSQCVIVTGVPEETDL